MDKVLEVLHELEESLVITRYAIGGAFALLFYTEPTLTYDVDVFVFLTEQGTKDLVHLGPLYHYLEAKGYRAEQEHVMIDGVPVQFIPVYDALVEAAVNVAEEKEYKGIRTRVLTLEHLLAIMMQTNRPKDRGRITQVIDEVSFDRLRLRDILGRHGLTARWEQYFGKI